MYCIVKRTSHVCVWLIQMAQRILLVDTNILLCALIAPKRSSADTQAQLVDAENMVYFSAANILEIAIKRRMAKRTSIFAR